MRSFGLLVLSVAIFSHAHASFDLMLIGNNSGGDYRVSRWDPINRLSMGSFGSGILVNPVQDVAVNQATNVAYVQSADKILMFNYNTGAYLGFGTTPQTSGGLHFNSNGQTLTIGDERGSGYIAQPALNPDLSSAGYSFGSTFASTAPMKRAGNSNYFAFTLEGLSPYNLSVTTWNSTGTFLNVAGTGIAWSSVNLNGFHDAAFSGTQMYGVQYDSALGRTRLWSSQTSSGFAQAPVAVEYIHAAAGVGVRRSISAAHNGGLWIKTGNEYSSYIPGVGNASSRSLSALGSATDLTGMAVIIAPEPGSFAALAFGALILLRRRR